ncbi:histidine triad nucleotide-binding protein [bacterium SCGC AG-212-C10]|nr:histidine triad nucleotide-binding protein [bacterium SCGC AG-212-C10]
MSDCLFCRMSSGEIPVERVAENEHAFAIRDINPRAPIHDLVIPKVHVPTAQDLGATHSAMLGGLFALAAEVARIENVYESGYRLAFNVGEAAGMTIWHLHLHLVGGRPLGAEG